MGRAPGVVWEMEAGDGVARELVGCPREWGQHFLGERSRAMMELGEGPEGRGHKGLEREQLTVGGERSLKVRGWWVGTDVGDMAERTGSDAAAPRPE